MTKKQWWQGWKLCPLGVETGDIFWVTSGMITNIIIILTWIIMSPAIPITLILQQFRKNET